MIGLSLHSPGAKLLIHTGASLTGATILLAGGSNNVEYVYDIGPSFEGQEMVNHSEETFGMDWSR